MARVPLWTLVVVPVLAGCYTYVPLGGTYPEPVPGRRVAVELTDTGRYAMSSQLGPEANRVEGVLLARSDSTYDMSVSMLVGLWGAQSKWEGEHVTLRREYVRRMSERRFSAWRTAVVAGGAGAGFLAFVLTRSLIGGGNTSDTPPPPPGNNN